MSFAISRMDYELPPTDLRVDFDFGGAVWDESSNGDSDTIRTFIYRGPVLALLRILIQNFPARAARKKIQNLPLPETSRAQGGPHLYTYITHWWASPTQSRTPRVKNTRAYCTLTPPLQRARKRTTTTEDRILRRSAQQTPSAPYPRTASPARRSGIRDDHSPHRLRASRAFRCSAGGHLIRATPWRLSPYMSPSS